MATIDYKEKYEKAVQAALLAKQDTESAVTIGILEDIFPELKESESEDERIRKQIKAFIKSRGSQITQSKTDGWLAWLKKQCEHANFRNKIQIGDKVTRNEDGVLVNLSQLNRVAKKQGEQKYIPKYKIGDYVKNTNYKGEPIYEIVYMDKECYICEYRGKEKMGDKAVMHFSFDNPYLRLVQNPADKVEPKFEIGDLITNGILVGIIDEIHELGYHAYFGDHYADVPDVENLHKWTIQDAKDGDVLNSTRVQATIIFKGFAEDGKHINAYCALQSGIFIHQEILWDRDFEPASKKWENALFDAMKEAGYEWDADKKELKKIEQKPQSTWKPSEEQIKALNYVVNLMASSERPTENDLYYNILKSLREQLKKLT